MTKLTWADVAQYYVGCEIMTPEGKEVIESIRNPTEYKYCVKIQRGDNPHLKLDQVKPILKRMEDMSKDEEILFLDLNYGSKQHFDMFSPVAFHYLISKGYNVFGLEESEFVDEKTVK